MKIQCTIVLDYETIKTAHAVYQATQVDDLDYVESQVKGKQIQALIRSASVSSLLHTVDDYLACVSVAESVGE